MVLWTENHIRTLLPALILMAIISLVLRKTLGGKSRKIRLIPFQILTVIILLLEVAKQYLSFQQGYDLYHIPLHYCSLAIFTMPLLAFYNGKFAGTLHAIAASICSAIFLLTAIYPDLIYGGQCVDGYFTSFWDFHTVTFHNVVMFAFLLIPALDLCAQPPKGAWKSVALFIVIYSAISAPVAQLLQTNYNNFYQCNIPPLEAVRQAVQAALGSTAAQIIYVLIVVVMDILFTVGAFYFAKLLKKLLWKEKEVASV